MNLLRISLLSLFFLAGSAFTTSVTRGFEESQKGFGRVRMAYANKQAHFNEVCALRGISESSFGNIFIRVFKQERILEVWVQRPEMGYVKFNEYRICSISGKIGPKRKQGDFQVPEGFYNINVFNPQSSYYLSLGINYPNESDRILSTSSNRGGDIYIHGECASIGCMAMDDFIEEIYMAAVKARNNGQENIPVQIFPFRMSMKNIDTYSSYSQYARNKTFWRNLAGGYWYFEKNNRLPDISVDSRGTYIFTNPSATQATK